MIAALNSATVKNAVLKFIVYTSLQKFFRRKIPSVNTDFTDIACHLFNGIPNPFAETSDNQVGSPFRNSCRINFSFFFQFSVDVDPQFLQIVSNCDPVPCIRFQLCPGYDFCCIRFPVFIYALTNQIKFTIGQDGKIKLFLGRTEDIESLDE